MTRLILYREKILDTRCVVVVHILPRWRNGMHGMRALARAHGASKELFRAQASKCKPCSRAAFFRVLSLASIRE